jgi:hypothetical protein
MPQHQAQRLDFFTCFSKASVWSRSVVPMFIIITKY